MNAQQTSTYYSGFGQRLNELVIEAQMQKRAVEESFPLSFLGLSGPGRALSPSTQDRLQDRGFLNRGIRGLGRDMLTGTGGFTGSAVGGLGGGVLGHTLSRLLGRNPETGILLGALGMGLPGGIAGAYGGYQMGGGSPPPLSFMDKLRLINKPASVKQAISGIPEAAELAGEGLMGGAKNLFSGAKNMFSRGAHDAERGIFGPALSGAPGMPGMAERLGFRAGNTSAGAWAHAHPGTVGALGAGIGGVGLAKGYDSMRDSARQRAMAEAPFGSRLMMALQYLTNPQGVANRLY